MCEWPCGMPALPPGPRWPRRPSRCWRGASDVVHGGPDAQGIPHWDFSTNANACGPAPLAWEAVDASRYPDPSYTDLRAALAAHHGVTSGRIVIAASASEFIARISTAIALGKPGAGV